MPVPNGTSIVILFCVGQIITCGSSFSLPFTLRIVGGNETTIENHPWQVSIQLFRRHFCSGSIISKDTILTAAHCITEIIAPTYQIVAGRTDLSDVEDSVYGIDRYIIHSGYAGDNENFDNDIAVLKLSSSLEFSNEVQPVQLPDENAPLPTGASVIASGWGVTEPGTDTPSKVLRDVTLNIVDKAQCVEIMRKAGPVTENMLCAGSESGGKDTCEYDSGGPLEYNGVLVGIVSWGDGCGRKGIPGVYTNVPKLRSWIRQQTGI